MTNVRGWIVVKNVKNTCVNISNDTSTVVQYLIRVTVFNATFNNISAISWQSVLLVVGYPEKTTDLSYVTDNLVNIPDKCEDQEIFCIFNAVLALDISFFNIPESPHYIITSLAYHEQLNQSHQKLFSLSFSQHSLQVPFQKEFFQIIPRPTKIYDLIFDV